MRYNQFNEWKLRIVKRKINRPKGHKLKNDLKLLNKQLLFPKITIFA